MPRTQTLNNISQCRTESAITPIISITGRLKWHRNHEFAVGGNSFLSRKLESLSRDYSALLRDNSTLSRDYAVLSREHASFSKDDAVRALQRSQWHRDYVRVPLKDI